MKLDLPPFRDIKYLSSCQEIASSIFDDAKETRRWKLLKMNIQTCIMLQGFAYNNNNKSKKTQLWKSVFIKILFLTAVNRLLPSYILWYETTAWERLTCLIMAFLCNFKKSCFREQCVNKILYAKPMGAIFVDLLIWPLCISNVLFSQSLNLVSHLLHPALQFLSVPLLLLKMIFPSLYTAAS